MTSLAPTPRIAPVRRLRPLTFLPDGDGVVVGCTDADAYVVLPPDGVELLRHLEGAVLNDATRAEAGRWYEQTYGEPVDVDDLVETLDDLGFVGAPPVQEATPRLRGRRAGELLYSRPVALLVLVLFAVAVGLMADDPTLVPHTDRLFFTDYLVVVELTVAFGQLPLILVHEVAHLLAARRLGVPARIRVSHRLYFVVFETVMDGLVVVPRRRRYLPMLAGMLADVVVVALLTVAAAVLRRGDSSLAASVCLALALSTLVRIALELVLFLRTDVYYLLCTVTGAFDLHSTSSQILANRFWGLVGRPGRRHDMAAWHPADVRAARWYAPLHLLGYAVAVVLLVVVLAPISWRFVETAGVRLLRPDLGSGHFYDALALLVLNVAQPAAAGLLWLRERRTRLSLPHLESRTS